LVTIGIVADGIGGRGRGAIAAKIAIESIVSVFLESESAEILSLISQGFVRASQSISEHDTGHPGMGTTCVIVVIHNQRLYTATVGNSHIYFLRDSTLRQLTRDHTAIQFMLDNGLITREKLREVHISHPWVKVIERDNPVTEPDFRLYLDIKESDKQAKANQGLPMHSGDSILLCSDGLYGMISDDQICGVLLKYTNPQEASERLVELVTEQDRYDDITAVVLRVP
jgi:protein phosphatase